MLQIVKDLQSNSTKNILQSHGVTYLGLFGSSARGDNSDSSDIDVLIDFDETKTLFDLAKIKIELQEKFGKNVDLSLRGHLKKQLETYITQDLITIYEEN